MQYNSFVGKREKSEKNISPGTSMPRLILLYSESLKSSHLEYQLYMLISRQRMDMHHFRNF